MAALAAHDNSQNRHAGGRHADASGPVDGH
jgi:hypothetical protein